MPLGVVTLDKNFLLNLIKNDRKFEVTKGVPRDASVISMFIDEDEALVMLVDSEGIPESKPREDLPDIDIELYGNADAVDENGELLPLKPAVTL